MWALQRAVHSAYGCTIPSAHPILAINCARFIVRDASALSDPMMRIGGGVGLQRAVRSVYECTICGVISLFLSCCRDHIQCVMSIQILCW